MQASFSAVAKTLNKAGNNFHNRFSEKYLSNLDELGQAKFSELLTVAPFADNPRDPKPAEYIVSDCLQTHYLKAYRNLLPGDQKNLRIFLDSYSRFFLDPDLFEEGAKLVGATLPTAQGRDALESLPNNFGIILPAKPAAGEPNTKYGRCSR